MGEWERKAQAKPHQQRCDLAGANSAADAEPKHIVVRCLLVEGAIPVPYGSVLRVVDRKRTRVEVFLIGRRVGEVCDEDTNVLRLEHSITTRPGSSFGAQCITATDGQEFSVQVEV